MTYACIHIPNFSNPPRSRTEEAAAHRSLIDCAYTFSPRVEDTDTDTVVLDLDGLGALFGTHREIAQHSSRCAAALGLRVRVAVAANPDAAVHAARGLPGITVIDPGHEAEQLSALPLPVLSPPPEILETLDRWGIRTCGDLARLPQVAIAERLGQEGIRLHELARGAGSRPLTGRQPSSDFRAEIELDHAVELLDPLVFVTKRLLDEVCSKVSTRGLAVAELHLCLELEQGCYERRLRLPLPVSTPRTLLKLLHLDLEAHPPPAPVVKVTLAAVPARERAFQNGLFVPPSPEPEKLELTMARIAGIVGEENIGSPELIDTHRPEAFHMTRFATSSQRRRANLPKHHALIALRVFRPPIESRVETRQGCPVRVTFSGISGQVVSTAGPWHTSGDWWTHDSWSHHEWDVALRSPSKRVGTGGGAHRKPAIALYRIGRVLATGKWFVRGIYD